MVDLKDWTFAPRIYVENTRGRDPAYEVTTEGVTRNLQSICRPAELSCHFADTRNLDALRRADILIAGRLPTAVIAEHAKNLKIIQCTSAGVESYIPFDWLGPNTTLTNASGVHASKVGAFGLMAALMLHEGVPHVATNQRQHVWKRQLRGPCAGRRVMIYGVGAIGGAVAEQLRLAGFRTIGIRRSGAPHPAVERMTTPDRLHEELAQADILILACPLTAETRGLIGARELAELPNGAGLLNISRSAVLDTSALVTALVKGHLSGAILDVFATEPLPSDDALWDVPNLMVFPHVSADDPDGYIDRCLAILADNLLRARSALPLRNAIDPERGY